MKKNNVLIISLTIFFSIIAFWGWWFGSYCIPRTTPSENHAKTVERIVVEKALRKMTLFSKNDVMAIYDISLGFNPTGHKEKKDDGRTPEGRYFIAEKIARSNNTLSLKISYPSQQDVLTARKRQVHPGENVMIHGYPNIYPEWLGNILLKNKDWTDGSIGLSNKDLMQLWNYAKTGTIIEIQP